MGVATGNFEMETGNYRASIFNQRSEFQGKKQPLTQTDSGMFFLFLGEGPW